mgnify:CR=1 FL=1
MMGKFLTTPLGSALRVFLGACLGGFVLYLSNGNSLTDINFDTVNAILTAAAIVAVPLVIAFVNPADPRWGRGSS